MPNYYLQSGEPRGVWLGDAAADLDLSGEVDDDAFLALLAGMDPRRPERHLGRRYGEDSVRGFDVTASAPKSVSILFAVGDDTTRREVLAAHDAAVPAMAGGSSVTLTPGIGSVVHGVPAARRRHQQARTDTHRQITTAEHAIEHAEQILDRHDRPLHRRRHQHDIDAAHRTLTHQPEILDHARRQLADTDTALPQLDADAASAADTLKRRPELRARVADIDHDLTTDRRARTRIARLEQPDTITNTLGPRPAPDHWDLAAGNLHQHHAAFNIHHGVGPQPRFSEHSAYATSREVLDQLIEPIHPDPPTPTINPPTIELGL